MTSEKSRAIQGLTTWLKTLGFGKRGNSWIKSQSDVTVVLSLQGSQSSTAECWKFTVNIGLWSRTVEELWDGVRPQKLPSSAIGCHMVSRIGDFGPIREDVWWTVRNQQEVDLAFREVKSRLETDIFPATSQITSDQDFIVLLAGASPWHAADQFLVRHFINLLEWKVSGSVGERPSVRDL